MSNTYRIALYENAFDQIGRVEDLAWPGLAGRLTAFRKSNGCASRPCTNKRCRGKNGPGWAPHALKPCPPKCAGDEYDCGGGQLHRLNANVESISVAVFDLDHVTAEKAAKINEVTMKKLTDEGFAYALHTTHGHQPPANLSCRLILPLSRPVTPAEWPAVRAAAINLLGVPADPATKDLARFYYLPDAPVGGDAHSEWRDGKPLDVESLFARPRPMIEPKTVPVDEAPVDPNAPVDIHAYADAILRHARAENRGIIRDALRGEPIPVGRQDDTLQKIASSAGFILPLAAPADAVVALFDQCLRACDWNEGVEHLRGEFLKKFERARERRRKRDALRAAQDALFVQALRAKIARRAPAVEDADPAGEEEGPAETWATKMLLADGSRWGELAPDARPKFKITVSNIVAVLRFSPEWRGCLRFDDVAKEIRCVGSPLGVVRNVETLDVDIACWFAGSEWGDAGLVPKAAQVREALLSVADANRYDPLRDEILALEWDGTERINGFFGRYFGAKGPDDYLQAVSRKWWVSLVARALTPGCKVDTVLVVEGLQGRGKSTAFDIIGSQWFTDTPINVNDKDSKMLSASRWIVELSESVIFKFASNEEIKAFFSSRVDYLRPPFGRTPQEFPRRAVFVGTTNSRNYLHRDDSGYRRWWPVQCERVDLEALRRDRSQLLAEAVAAFERGEQWWLTEEEQALADAQAAERQNGAGEMWEDEVVHFFLSKPLANRPTQVRLADLAEKVFGLTPGQAGRDIEMRLAPILRALGFTRSRSGPTNARVWKPPQAWLAAEQTVDGGKN